MSAKRHDDKRRLTVLCSDRQREMIRAAAAAAGTDVSTWVLAMGMRHAAPGTGTGDPVVLAGAVADRLRAAGERQGLTPERALEQLLIAGAG